MNYIAHFQQFIKLYKTPLNPKNGLPSTTEPADNQRVLFLFALLFTLFDFSTRIIILLYCPFTA